MTAEAGVNDIPAGYVLKSTIHQFCHGVIEHKRPPHTLPTPLHDLWRDGFAAGVASMAVRVANAEAQADRLYYRLYNPDEARAEHEARLSLFATARGRENDVQRRAALDRLEKTDPIEYRRVVHLGLTDRAAYIAALETEHSKEVAA